MTGWPILRIDRSASLPYCVLVYIAGLATVVTGLGACADSGHPSDSASLEVAIDTIGDTVVVRTAHGQVWPRNARLVANLSIGGTLDGDEREQFGDVLGLAVGNEGRIYVVDGHGPIVRAYGPDGDWLFDVGRSGEGPGEYKRPDGGVAVLPASRLAIRDPGNGRILIFTAEGDYERSLPLGGGFSTNQPLFATLSGELLTPTLKKRGVPVLEWQWVLARYGPDGAMDTLPIPDLGFEPAVVSAARGNSSSFDYVPYSPQELWTYCAAGRFVVGVNDEYSLTVLRNRETPLRIVRSYEPTPVLAREAEILRNRIIRRFQIGYPGWTWNGPPVPDHKPPYYEIFCAKDGRIWVRVHTPSVRYLSPDEMREAEEESSMPVNPYREALSFDVFASSGEYLGRVDSDAQIRTQPAPVIRGDTMWAVVTDELDVARIERFVLEPVSE